MRRYYTRVCNFYYGNISKDLVKKVDPKERAKQAAKTRKMAPDVKAKYKKEKAHTNLVKSMGVDPENDWRASYQILPDKTKVVAELQKLAMNADAIYLATDLDREGEAIAWHLKDEILKHLRKRNLKGYYLFPLPEVHVVKL